MFESLGIVMLTALMAATEPAITPSELQKNCEKLAAEKFNRETANDEIDSTTEGITMLV